VREDVQSLLRRVLVRPDEEMSKRFPEEMPCRIQIFLEDGQTLSIEKRDYEGFHARPMSWERAAMKFERLAAPYTDDQLRRDIMEAVVHLETIEVQHLTDLLSEVTRRD